MIPVMLMGYVVSGKRYKCVEYLVALGVTAGVATFKLYEVNDAPVKNTELLGVAFIFTYMVCDSFTSNWQSKIFKQHQVNSMTMMLNVNIFSSAFTGSVTISSPRSAVPPPAPDHLSPPLLFPSPLPPLLPYPPYPPPSPQRSAWW